MVRETRYLLVGNLPENVTEEEISEYFKRWVLPTQGSKHVEKKWGQHCGRDETIPLNGIIKIDENYLVKLVLFVVCSYRGMWNYILILNGVVDLVIFPRQNTKPRFVFHHECVYFIFFVFTFCLILWIIFIAFHRWNY